MSDEPRVSRRRFLGDFAFLGAGLVASIAWAWAHHEAPSDAQATPAPSGSTNAPTPSATESPKARTPEFDHPPMPGEMIYVPPTPGAKPAPKKKPGCK